MNENEVVLDYEVLTAPSSALGVTKPETPAEELARIIAERDLITARIYELRRQLKQDYRGGMPIKKGEFEGLPFRAVVYLRRAGFRTRAKLEEVYEREGRAGLARMRRIGPGTLAHVERWLKGHATETQNRVVGDETGPPINDSNLPCK
jgi:hypothetical protein